MRTRLRNAAVLASALLAISLTGATGASAATQVGNDCVVSTGSADVAAVQLTRDPSSPFPIGAPTAGVVTKWKQTLIEVVEEQIPTKMVVFRPTADPKQFLTVAESPLVTVHKGVNTFDVRIPVQAGDRFGTTGTTPGGALFCVTGSAADVIGLGLPSSPGANMSVLAESDETLTGVLATVEPDADNDGYGDETQDLCPQSATTQAACPVVVLDAYAIAGKGSATVLISSSTEAPITVSGTVALPKGKASSSAKATLKKVTKKVKPGAIGKFKLKFPGSLKSAIAALPPGKSLTLKITASAKNVAGAVSKDKTKLKLKASG